MPPAAMSTGLQKGCKKRYEKVLQHDSPMEGTLTEIQQVLSETIEVLTCEICDRIMEKPHMLTCGHLYCEECLVTKFHEKITNILSGMDMLYVQDCIGGNLEQFTNYPALKKNMYWEEADKVFQQKCLGCGQGVKSCPTLVWPIWSLLEKLKEEDTVKKARDCMLDFENQAQADNQDPATCEDYQNPAQEERTMITKDCQSPMWDEGHQNPTQCHQATMTTMMMMSHDNSKSSGGGKVRIDEETGGCKHSTPNEKGKACGAY
ncbi:hypothetical protein BDN71DRAFT_1433116 [Pleurotus eryngii]|uniref:RING-type domain-containing protein n=1 Tax=Pleurotus eryngii TaxID=5323 RepID=A0A9P6DD88_PLEER|nr:hypothetical protein BDN71DRAFT_1433116 [Pleurotus eryngii]